MADTLETALEARKPELDKLLAPIKYLTADRMLRVVFTALERNPDLRRCTKESIISAVMVCGELGLEPMTPLGHVYLVPFGTACTPIVGYKGLIQLAITCGAVNDIRAGIRREGVEFHFRRLHPTEPIIYDDENDDHTRAILGAYAVAYLPNGLVRAEYMTKAEVEKIRGQSKAGQSGPWVTHWERMALKTVIRRLLQYSRLAGEMPRIEKAIELEEKDYVELPPDLAPPSQPESAAAVSSKSAVPPNSGPNPAAAAPVDDGPPIGDAGATALLEFARAKLGLAGPGRVFSLLADEPFLASADGEASQLNATQEQAIRTCLERDAETQRRRRNE